MTISFGFSASAICSGGVVVDLFLGVEAVGDDAIQLAGKVDRRAVREVAAHRERHAQDRVAGLQHRGVHRLVRLRAGMRLHVRPRRAEQLLRALDGERLGHVDVLAAAVVALAGIALGVLVGELAALRDQHLAADVVLGGDQLDVVFLASGFPAGWRSRARDRTGREGREIASPNFTGILGTP